MIKKHEDVKEYFYHFFRIVMLNSQNLIKESVSYKEYILIYDTTGWSIFKLYLFLKNLKWWNNEASCTYRNKKDGTRWNGVSGLNKR